MNTQELADCLEQQKEEGFLPLARTIKELAPGIYTGSLRFALSKAIPKEHQKTIRTGPEKQNRLIFFMATQKNLAIVRKVCEEFCRKAEEEKKLWTSKMLADVLREKHNLPVSPDNLAWHAKKGNLPSIESGRRRLFQPKNLGRIKKAVLEVLAKEGRK